MKGNFSSKFKKAAFGLTAITTSLLIGMTAACAQNTTDDDDDDKVTTKEDLQVIKNGNFEFYDDNDGLYPISTPDSWDFSYSGTNSSSMSGIIKTSKEGWDYLTDPALPETLEANDDLSSDDKNKKDYNGALTDDMLYKNMHDALEDSTTDDDDDDKKAYIANPNTHNLRWDSENNKYVYVNENGATADVYTKDEKVYSDAEYKNEIGTSVLMLHNFRNNYFRGTEGYFESNTTISLEANTTCKISVWVKTAELYCDNGAGERTKSTSEKGAYIKVNSSVGGNSLDSFTIKNINTEVLNPDTVDDKGNVTALAADNGWVQYTVYVQASSFATTEISLTLGLGDNSNNGTKTVEGYAFFDDITFEKYRNLDLLKESNSTFDTTIRATDGADDIANTCYPLAADAKMGFRVDVPVSQTNAPDGSLTEYVGPNNSQDKNFFINFASTEANTINLTSSNVNSGLTVDSDKYISSKNTGVKSIGVGSLNNGAENAKLPATIKNNGLTVSSDLLMLTDVTNEWSLNVSGFEYNQLLTDSLKSASNLPGVKAHSAKTLIMLSANGAAYETRIGNTDTTFIIDDGEYKLISFWLKTSDFSSKTAATITVYDQMDEDNSSSFNLDTTTQSATDFGDEKDIYDGWVRCYLRISNTSGVDGKSFGIKINLGNTTIKGTTANDYKYGWIAIANLSVMNLDKDVYGYTSGLSNSADINFAETNETFSKAFDSEQGGTSSQIKTDLATPSNYTGANGNSVAVKPTGSSATDYDTTNNNDYAGLLNKENLDNYKDKDWYSKVYPHLAGAPVENEDIWNALAGKYSYQPLLIVNAVRELNESAKVYNYGYIGNKSSFSADSYSKVSVRVKVSEGAIAYVYLIDTDSENNDVLTFKTPDVNFYYDDDGNILREAADDKDTAQEAKAKIAYTLRDDGLYENGDGKLYANYYNLTKYYDYKYEHEKFFDAEGNAVTFENLVTGVTYYADANKTKLAPHYLIAGGKENNKVYEYAGEIDGKSAYYYVESGVANKNKVVYGVDKNIASYTYDASTATPYSFVIDGNDSRYADKWVTVTFNVHTGNEDKNYRLELWSGERDKEYTDGIANNSYVLFDYSPENESSLDSATYESKLAYYTNAIRADLIENLKDGAELPDNEQSITQLEKLVNSGYEKLYDYSATYYTFSLYDSPAFIPFNAETAEEGQTGYSYLYSDYEESLGLLKVIDNDDVNNLSMTAFVDYSVTDKKFDIIGEPTVDTDDDTDTDTTNTDNSNVWLLAASIAIVVAILVAIIAILVKQFISKHGKNKKHVGKNTYNFNKNKRYVKKYVKANGEAPEVSDEIETLDEQPVEESVEQTVEEQPTTPAEEQTEAVEQSTEEAPVDENGSEGEDKKPE